MKTRGWVILFAALALLCAGLCFGIRQEKADFAYVYSEGALVLTIDLSVDASYRVERGADWNELTVCAGRLYVSAASCPTQDCMRSGAATAGLPIVCLPNDLLICFADGSALDALLG